MAPRDELLQPMLQGGEGDGSSGGGLLLRELAAAAAAQGPQELEQEQEQEQTPPPRGPLLLPESDGEADDELGHMLLAKLLAGPAGRKRGVDFDWSSSTATSSAGTPQKGSSPLRRKGGQQEQHQQQPGEGGWQEEEGDEGELIVESFWESPVFVSIVQELLVWPLGVLHSAVVLLICTWAHLTNLALYRLSRLLRRLGHAWRRLRPGKSPASLVSGSGSGSLTGSSSMSLNLPDRLARMASIQVVKSGLHWCGPNNTLVKDASVGAASPGGDVAKCAYFVPGRPSVIYVHGYQPRTLIRRFRESLNWADNDSDYGIDVNAADHWIKAGYNVGIFYWNQYADEPFIHDAEAKIWTHETSVGMRYRKLSDCGRHVKTRYVFLSHIPCVSQQLADALQHRFPLGAAPYRLVGHSLGSQVVIHAATLMARARRAEVEARDSPSFVLPTRIALLDPFFTMTPKAYLGWRTLPAVLTKEVEELKDEARIVFETYKTSILSHAAANALRPHSAFFEVNLPHVPWWKLRSRHVAAPYIYFMSFAVPEIGRYICGDDFGAHIEQLSELSHEAQEARDSFLNMARTSDEHLRMLMDASIVDDLWQLFTSYMATSS